MCPSSLWKAHVSVKLEARLASLVISQIDFSGSTKLNEYGDKGNVLKAKNGVHV